MFALLLDRFKAVLAKVLSIKSLVEAKETADAAAVEDVLKQLETSVDELIALYTPATAPVETPAS